MNNQKFNTRSEALDFGANYEFLMAACYGLILSFAEEVKDFKLSTNNQDMGNFDDVVIEIKFSDGSEYLYAFQLKHRGSKEKNIKMLSFTADKGDYGLKKYCKGFNDVKTTYQNNSSSNVPFENFRFILYTNGFLPTFTTYDKTLRKKVPVNELAASEDITVYRYDQCVLKNLVNLSSDSTYFIYKFKSDKEELLDEEFLQQFFLYTKQKDAREVERHINQIIFDIFSDCDPSVVTNYLSFFKNWWRGDFGAFKLTKEDILLKLAEYVLFPHIPEVHFKSFPSSPSEKSKLLNDCFSAFDLTLIENSTNDSAEETVWGAILFEIFNEIDKSWLWSQPLPKESKPLFLDKKEVPISAKGENFIEQSAKKIYTILWHKNVIPMFVKANANCRRCIYKTVRLVQSLENKKKFIILDTNTVNGDVLQEVRIFRNLSNLVDCGTLYKRVCEELEVSLQGRRCIKLENFTKIDSSVLTTISTREILYLFSSNSVIGEDCKKDLPRHYIKRLIPKILLDIRGVEEIEDDLFVISCPSDYDVAEFNMKTLDIDTYCQLVQSNFLRKFPVLEKESVQQFEKICSINTNKNCHHVKIVNKEKIEWIETHGSINNLIQYQIHLKEFKDDDFVKDLKILDYFKNKLNIICADPGMGKSVTLKLLQFYCPSNHWVIFVRLSDHIKFFKEQHTVEEVLKYFVNFETKSNFVQNVAKIFISKKQVLFLWDAFDELPSNCLDAVVSVTKSLKNLGYWQWIAGRSSMKKFLESTYGTFSLTIAQFSALNQWNFIHDNIKERYHVDEVDLLTNKLNESMSSSLRCGYFDYSGIPLHIYMIMEIFLKNPQQYLNDCKIVILTDIYQKFVEGKFENLFYRAKANKNNFLMQKIKAKFEKTCLLDYETAALKTSFDEQSFASLGISCDGLIQKIKNHMDIVGIIVGVNAEGKPIFTHKTYEEYLTAFWLSKNYKHHPHLLLKLFEDDYRNIRLMFDMILASDSPIHIAVIYQNLPILEKYQDKIPGCRDKGGRNPLHVACSWGSTHSLLDVIENTPEKIVIAADVNVITGRVNNTEIVTFLLGKKCDPFAEDELMKWSVVEYAAKTRSLASINTILACNYKINSSTITNYCDIQTLLYYCIKYDYLYLFDSLIRNNYPAIEIRMVSGEMISLLQFAIKMNRLSFVDKLMNCQH